MEKVHVKTKPKPNLKVKVKVTGKKIKKEKLDEPITVQEPKEVEVKNETPTGVHPGGRPLTYSPEIIKLGYQYLSECIDENYRLTKTEGETSTSYENKIKVKIPQIARLALYLKITKETVYDWADKYPEFSDLVKELMSRQEAILLEKSLSNDYNPMISKLMLTKHGYKDSSENDITTGGKPLGQNIIEAISKAYGEAK